MYKIVAALAALALLAVPTVAGDHADDESALGTGEIPDVTAGFYIAVDEEAGTAGLYEESNEHAGLQTEETVDENDELVPADTEILAL